MPVSAGTPKGLLRVMYLAVIACGLAFVVMAGRHLRDQIAWDRNYKAVASFGANGDCDIAVKARGSTKEPSGTDFRPQQVPMRGTASEPQLASGDQLITRCRVDLRHLDPRYSAHLSLGPAFGASTLALNGQTRIVTASDADLDLDLSPTELQLGRAELVLRSVVLQPPIAGLGSLIPPYVTQDGEALKAIARFRIGFNLEQRPFRFAIAAMLALMLALLVRFGVDYRDVVWLAILAAVVAFSNAFAYFSNLLGPSAVAQRGEAALNFAAVFALLSFHTHLMRPTRSWLWLGRGLGGAWLCCTLLVLVAGDELFFAWRMLTRLQGWTLILGLGPILAATATLALRDKSGPAQRRLAIYFWLGSLSIAMTGLDLYFEDHNAVYLRPMTLLTLVLSYTATLFVDLARRQSLYFAERAHRETIERELGVVGAIADTARMLAHDIRRPFRWIQFYGQRLWGDGLPAEAATTDLAQFRDSVWKKIGEACTEVEATLTNLVSLGRDHAAELGAVDPQKILLAAVETQQSIGPKPLAIQWSLAPARVTADARMLQRILANLIENAVQATPSGGTVRIALAAGTAGRVQIEVHNSGSHVPAELIPRLFEFGYTSGKASGTGLGLAIAQRLSQAMNGQLTCTSSLATGTSFVLELPAAAGSCERLSAELPRSFAAREPWQPVASSTHRIVLIDDDELQQVAWRLTAGAGVMIPYRDPESFIAALESQALGDGAALICVVDWHFRSSQLTGRDVLAALRRALPEARVVLSSNETEFAEATLSAFDAVIGKEPMTAPELQDLLEKTNTAAAS